LIGSMLSCESQKGVEPRSKGNAPPSITSIQILPEKPQVDSELSLIIQSQDPNGDPITYEYQWLKNDKEIFGENRSILARGSYRKGDVLRVRVVASNGKDKGPPFLTAPLQVLNSPPLIQEVWIEPRVLHTNDHPKGFAKATDKDGDSVYFAYQWEVNGTASPEERGEVLEHGSLKKGDTITVVVTPDDRETLGAPRKSDPVLVVNSPPVITSSPPISAQGNVYQYQVNVSDPDQDPITFTLKLGPKGMEIDKKTGLLRWEIRQEDKGTHTIEIEASDNEGAKSLQRYTLAVDFK
jgi:hypothetical protein